MVSRRARTIGIALLAGVVPFALASCGDHADSKSATAGAPAAPNGGAASFNGSSHSPAPTTSPAGVDLAVAERPASDRQVISTAQLDMQAHDIDATVARATTLVVDAGGYVFSESASLTSAQHAHVVFEVPPERFADVIARIGRLGTLVHRRIGTQDVTGQVVDLGARLQAARTSAERLRELLAHSAGVGDLLGVESQLTQREGQVDSLAGALGALRARVDMATITVDVSPVAGKRLPCGDGPDRRSRGRHPVAVPGPGARPGRLVAGPPPQADPEPGPRSRAVRLDFSRPAHRPMLPFGMQRTVGGSGHGMDAGGINVVRSLPIDPAIANGMLHALRRDTPGSATGWSLGRRGSAEVDIDFLRTGAPNPTWTATARLWDPQAVAVVRAVVDLTVVEPDTCELSIRPNLPLSPWWSARMPALLDLARAALDELAEELLWHASREDLPSPELP